MNLEQLRNEFDAAMIRTIPGAIPDIQSSIIRAEQQQFRDLTQAATEVVWTEQQRLNSSVSMLVSEVVRRLHHVDNRDSRLSNWLQRQVSPQDWSEASSALEIALGQGWRGDLREKLLIGELSSLGVDQIVTLDLIAIREERVAASLAEGSLGNMRGGITTRTLFPDLETVPALISSIESGDKDSEPLRVRQCVGFPRFISSRQVERTFCIFQTLEAKMATGENTVLNKAHVKAKLQKANREPAMEAQIEAQKAKLLADIIGQRERTEATLEFLETVMED